PAGAPDERGHSSCIWMLSLSSKPVNGFACRSLLDAPRDAPIRRLRYIAWSENWLVLMNHAIRSPRTASATATPATMSTGDDTRTPPRPKGPVGAPPPPPRPPPPPPPP